MSPQQASLREALSKMSASDRERWRQWAAQAEARDAKLQPIPGDRFMASAGGNAARYREVTFVEKETGEVHYVENHRPFQRQGRPGKMPIQKWLTWTKKASVEWKASLETRIPGLPGSCLHWELLNALGDADTTNTH